MSSIYEELLGAEADTVEDFLPAVLCIENVELHNDRQNAIDRWATAIADDIPKQREWIKKAALARLAAVTRETRGGVHECNSDIHPQGVVDAFGKAWALMWNKPHVADAFIPDRTRHDFTVEEFEAMARSTATGVQK